MRVGSVVWLIWSRVQICEWSGDIHLSGIKSLLRVIPSLRRASLACEKEVINCFRQVCHGQGHDRICHHFCHCDWMRHWIQDATDFFVTSEVKIECLVLSLDTTGSCLGWWHSSPRDYTSFEHSFEHATWFWYCKLLTFPITTWITVGVVTWYSIELWVANDHPVARWGHDHGCPKCQREKQEGWPRVEHWIPREREKGKKGIGVVRGSWDRRWA